MSADRQLRTFATCAGRLSALMEFQWMFDGPASERTAAQRETVIEWLTAAMPEDRSGEVLGWRISAKTAHAALLSRSAFATDPRDAAWAAERAEELVGECTAMLLS